MSLRLLRGVEARSHQYAFSAEHHGSGEAATVGNSSRGDHGRPWASIHNLRQQQQERFRLAVSSGGDILASIDNDSNLWLWDARAGKQLRTIKIGLSQRDGNLVFSPDNKTLVSQSQDGVMQLWDVTSGKLLRRIEASYAGTLAFSPDGKTLAATEGCGIHLWDVASGKERLGWPGHRREVHSITFSGDSKALASGFCKSRRWI